MGDMSNWLLFLYLAGWKKKKEEAMYPEMTQLREWNVDL